MKHFGWLIWVICWMVEGVVMVEQEKNPCRGDPVKIGDASELTVPVKAGEPFAIEFSGNPSTGFSWTVELPRPDAGIEVLDERHQPSQSGLMGAPEKVIWCFRAGVAGDWVIRFLYRRPWETEVKPEREVLVRLRVTET